MGRILSCLFQWLLAFLGLSMYHSNLCPHGAFYLCFLIKTPVIGFRVHPSLVWPHFN
jgi:uncharacterized membrane protein SpoIIM required for sporulation